MSFEAQRKKRLREADPQPLEIQADDITTDELSRDLTSILQSCATNTSLTSSSLWEQLKGQLEEIRLYTKAHDQYSAEAEELLSSSQMQGFESLAQAALLEEKCRKLQSENENLKSLLSEEGVQSIKSLVVKNLEGFEECAVPVLAASRAEATEAEKQASEMFAILKESLKELGTLRTKLIKQNCEERKKRGQTEGELQVVKAQLDVTQRTNEMQKEEIIHLLRLVEKTGKQVSSHAELKKKVHVLEVLNKKMERELPLEKVQACSLSPEECASILDVTNSLPDISGHYQQQGSGDDVQEDDILRRISPDFYSMKLLKKQNLSVGEMLIAWEGAQSQCSELRKQIAEATQAEKKLTEQARDLAIVYSDELRRREIAENELKRLQDDVYRWETGGGAAHTSDGGGVDDDGPKLQKQLHQFQLQHSELLDDKAHLSVSLEKARDVIVELERKNRSLENKASALASELSASEVAQSIAALRAHYTSSSAVYTSQLEKLSRESRLQKEQTAALNRRLEVSNKLRTEALDSVTSVKQYVEMLNAQYQSAMGSLNVASKDRLRLQEELGTTRSKLAEVQSRLAQEEGRNAASGSKFGGGSREEMLSQSKFLPELQHSLDQLHRLTASALARRSEVLVFDEAEKAARSAMEDQLQKCVINIASVARKAIENTNQMRANFVKKSASDCETIEGLRAQLKDLQERYDQLEESSRQQTLFLERCAIPAAESVLMHSVTSQTSCERCQLSAEKLEAALVELEASKETAEQAVLKQRELERQNVSLQGMVEEQVELLRIGQAKEQGWVQRHASLRVQNLQLRASLDALAAATATATGTPGGQKGEREPDEINSASSSDAIERQREEVDQRIATEKEEERRQQQQGASASLHQLLETMLSIESTATNILSMKLPSTLQQQGEEGGVNSASQMMSGSSATSSSAMSSVLVPELTRLHQTLKEMWDRVGVLAPFLPPRKEVAVAQPQPSLPSAKTVTAQLADANTQTVNEVSVATTTTTTTTTDASAPAPLAEQKPSDSALTAKIEEQQIIIETLRTELEIIKSTAAAAAAAGTNASGDGGRIEKELREEVDQLKNDKKRLVGMIQMMERLKNAEKTRS